MMRRRPVLLMISLLAALAVPSFIQSAPRHRAADQSIAIVTGPETGTYFAFGRNLAEVSQSVGQPVDVRGTSGSIENLKLMTKSGENAALGIVQSDVLGFLRRSTNVSSREIAEKLRLVFPFYQEEVHVLARREIASIDQLKGKRVVIGEEGSGNALTAINLFALLGVETEKLVQLPPAEGVLAVLADEADAMVFVGGKPVPLFDNLAGLKTADGGKNAQLLEEVHFLPLKDERLLKDYEPAELSPQDYPFISAPVPTVAVTAVLVAYDFSTGKNSYHIRRCEELARIGSAVRQHLTYLKESGHPKWKQVDFSRPLGEWKRDICAWRDTAVAAAPAKTDAPRKPRFSSALERDLLNVIKHGKGQP